MWSICVELVTVREGRVLVPVKRRAAGVVTGPWLVPSNKPCEWWKTISKQIRRGHERG